jgi:DNA polymerase I-like protein with 3'-5' exonuclease and polymerase domains
MNEDTEIPDDFFDNMGKIGDKPVEVVTQDSGDTPESLVAAPPIPAKPSRDTALPFDDDDPNAADSFFAEVRVEREIKADVKPWMKHHEFIVVKTIPELEAILEEAFKTKRCALDLETQGLDSRIEYDEEGRPKTKHQIVGYCLSPGDGKKGYYVPVRHRPRDGGPGDNLPLEEVDALITKLCRASQPTPEDGEVDPLGFVRMKTPPSVILYFWNAKFDQEFLYPVTGIDFWHPESFEDGLLAAFVLYTDDELGLKAKAESLLKDPEGNPYEMIKFKDLFVKGRALQFDQLSPEEARYYACSDAICTNLLCQLDTIIPAVRKRINLTATYRIEKQVIQVTRVMERNRVKVDRERLRNLLNKHFERREAVRAQIVELAEKRGFKGFEPGSSKQLSDFLFGEKGLDIKLTKEHPDFPGGKPQILQASKQYKTDASTIEQLVNEMGRDNAPAVLNQMIEWREHDKIIGTYLEKLVNNPDKNDELRFNFKETGAATGRFSAPQGDSTQGYSGVPVHGIPGDSDMRQAFIAREGYTMVKSDYAGQELRIAANVSGEPVWIDEFLRPGGGDLHTITARAFFSTEKPTPEQRKMAKIANFALVYGGGPAAIMRATGCDRTEATRRKQAFDKALPVFAAWVKGQHKKVKEDRGITNPFGRWIAIPDAAAKAGDVVHGKLLLEEDAKKIRAACERHSTNYPIQSSGADIMKIALVKLHKEFHVRGWLRNGGDDSIRMLLTVHDEIVFEIRHDRMEEAIPLIIEGMAYPGKVPRLPFSPPWRIPLIVEPLIGDSWGGKYNWEMMTLGKEGVIADMKLKEHEIPYHIEMNGRVYHKIPPWLEGHVKPGWERPHEESPKKSLLRTVGGLPSRPPGGSNGSVRSSNGGDSGGLNGVSVRAAIPPPPLKPSFSSATAPAASHLSGNKVVRFMIEKLSNATVRTVYQLVAKCHEFNGPVLVLTHATSQETLIDASLGIRVDPVKFADSLKEYTLSDGRYDTGPYQKAIGANG